MRVIEIHENILADQGAAAQRVRNGMTGAGTLFLNFMSAPGSGKTTTLVALIHLLKEEFRIGNMDVDIESSLDAVRVADAAGIVSVQIHNGGLCHIDADMVERALEGFDGFKRADGKGLDILFLENIGNMVCPAEFDTGAHKNIMLYSVPEGDDKPLKYPLMFHTADLILINKIDALPYFDFDMDKAVSRIRQLNPRAVIIPISAVRGDGLEKTAEWIRRTYKEIVEK